MVNLFWLSPPRYARGGLNYSWCARQHIDAHIIKIPLEAAQLLYGAHHALPVASDWRTRAPMAKTGERGYKATHMNNPISKWLRESAAHYRHAAAYGLALCAEYRHRYGREHACEAHLHWLQSNEPAIPDVNKQEDPQGDEVLRFKIKRAPPCAMPDEFKVSPPAELPEEGKEEATDPEDGPATTSTSSSSSPFFPGGADNSDLESSLSLSSEEEEHDKPKSQRKRKRTDDKGKERITHESEEEAIDKEERVSELKQELMLDASLKEEEKPIINTIQSTRTTVTLTTEEETETGTIKQELKIEEEEEEQETSVPNEDDEEALRVQSLLMPIEEEVAASEVAFPLYVYQSYRAYYLGQKLSLKMSTFKTRNVPHWAQERLDEIQSMPKAKKAKTTTSTTSRRKRTTTATITVTSTRPRRKGAAYASDASPTPKRERKKRKEKLSAWEEEGKSDRNDEDFGATKRKMKSSGATKQKSPKKTKKKEEEEED